MNSWVDSVLVLLALGDLFLLGSSRIGACIRVVGVQGILLGVLTLLARPEDLSTRTVALSLLSMATKGLVLPWLLVRARRQIDVRRENEPFVGYVASILVGAAALAVSLWLGSRLPLPDPVVSTLVVPAAFFTILTGLFLIVGRKMALTQVIGYLVLENGIYAFGVALVQKEHVLVELGILLDVFVAVFVMGIAIFHISREFDHIDTERLASLRD